MSENQAAETACVDGVCILDIHGVERISLAGELTADQLASKLVDFWVPYVTCSRKCSRSDYCRHVYTEEGQRFPTVEVRCGVCAEALRGFIRVHFSEFRELDRRQKELFLDAAYHLAAFVGHAEFGIGFCSDLETVEWWGEAAPLLFSNLIKSRDSLNRAATAMRELPFLMSLQHVLLVEGKSEKAFLETLKRSHLAHLLRVEVESYDGKSNKRARRIEMLLQKYETDGYRVFLQGDADGANPKDVFSALIRKGLVSEEQVFAFSYDFETAVPTRLLFEGLRSLGYLGDVDPEAFSEDVKRLTQGSVLPVLREVFKIPIESCKTELASEMGILLAAALPISDERFCKTELGRFLDFIRTFP